MKLTHNEQLMHKNFSTPVDGKVRCHECPLNLADKFDGDLVCYATIDEKKAKEMNLTRY